MCRLVLQPCVDTALDAAPHTHSRHGFGFGSGACLEHRQTLKDSKVSGPGPRAALSEDVEESVGSLWALLVYQKVDPHLPQQGDFRE